ncbi:MULTISPECIES: transcription elongation factor GreA [unclassified Ruminococcus]|uniref:transcription elongation factor GreA n=1 Tax=unclassified Ruminococcus TaxID=2608920 RepID=UPI00210ECD9C|nr:MULTISPECIES: transcription elongation factor GreA [unclassified Ruminococcus]MCQ4023345.1 transcription elongation factor GreA [Ruminococcus sp. zg-924]MCQ4115375.1 transcription elongation factor GreA [Ruminococcus sp. zg-921]
MQNKKEILLTLEGKAKLEKELELLKTVKRKEVTEKIKVALSFGDLSENSEYDDAKNEQAIVEAKIQSLEAQLHNSRIIDDSEIDTQSVSMGVCVKLRVGGTTEVSYNIVPTREANPLEGKISDESPVGAALIGKKLGESVSVETPGGVVEYTILDITR